MKNLFILVILISGISWQAQANCQKYGSGGGGITVNFGTTAILADSTLPNGSILATAVRGGNVTDIKTYSGCAPDDIFVIRSTNDIDTGVTGVQNMPVYATGIPGIGYQMSDITIGTIRRPIPAKLNDPIPANSHTYSKTSISGQVTVWLVKTGPITKNQLPGLITVYFLAGTPGSQTQGTGNPNSSQLLKININLSSIRFKETTCNVNPRGGSTVMLQSIDVSQLKALGQGAATGKQKKITLDISCPDSEVGLNYLYWFNPITENSSTTDGVLLNALPSGAKNVGFIIKKGASPIKFYDLDSYEYRSMAKNQTLELTADYYKLSDDVSVGTTGEVKGQFEIILQEK